jgi:predicted nucleic acid-binding protein
MILLDTGYLLALVDPLDELHARALAWTGVLREPMLVSEIVLWECGNHLWAPVERPKFHALIQRLRANAQCRVIDASPALFAAAIEFHRRHADKSWSLTDCLSFHLMREMGMTRALAYDHHFEQAGFEALLRREP